MRFEMDSVNEILNIYSYSTCICSIRLAEQKYPKISFDCGYYSNTTTRHQGLALAIALNCLRDMHTAVSDYIIYREKALNGLRVRFGYIRKENWKKVCKQYDIYIYNI